MRHVYGEGSDITEGDITITAGCNMAYSAAIMSLAGEGDEVILPVPWCVSLFSSYVSLVVVDGFGIRYFNHQSVLFFFFFTDFYPCVLT
jgi:aspartate/methionine/tyrosine aminotransferase